MAATPWWLLGPLKESSFQAVDLFDRYAPLSGHSSYAGMLPFISPFVCKPSPLPDRF